MVWGQTAMGSISRFWKSNRSVDNADDSNNSSEFEIERSDLPKSVEDLVAMNEARYAVPETDGMYVVGSILKIEGSEKYKISGKRIFEGGRHVDRVLDVVLDQEDNLSQVIEKESYTKTVQAPVHYQPINSNNADIWAVGQDLSLPDFTESTLTTRTINNSSVTNYSAIHNSDEGSLLGRLYSLLTIDVAVQPPKTAPDIPDFTGIESAYIVSSPDTGRESIEVIAELAQPATIHRPNPDDIFDPTVPDGVHDLVSEAVNSLGTKTYYAALVRFDFINPQKGSKDPIKGIDPTSRKVYAFREAKPV